MINLIVVVSPDMRREFLLAEDAKRDNVSFVENGLDHVDSQSNTNNPEKKKGKEWRKKNSFWRSRSNTRTAEASTPVKVVSESETKMSQDVVPVVSESLATRSKERRNTTSSMSSGQSVGALREVVTS